MAGEAQLPVFGAPIHKNLFLLLSYIAVIFRPAKGTRKEEVFYPYNVSGKSTEEMVFNLALR